MQSNVTSPPLVPSEHEITDSLLLNCIQGTINDLLERPPHHRGCPVPAPVSLERRRLNWLKTKEYVVSEKSDGVQYVLLLGTWPPHLMHGRPYAVMVNRSMNVYEVQVLACARYFDRGTMLLGELVWDTVQHHNQQVLRQTFLVFDAYVLAGEPLHKWSNYVKRYNYIKTCIQVEKDIMDMPNRWPEVALCLAQDGHIVCETSRHFMRFQVKKCVSINHLRQMYGLLGHLTHNTDGLIFTPVCEPVHWGRQESLLKWKPENTIDLEVLAERVDGGSWMHWLHYRDKGRLIDGAIAGIEVHQSSSSGERYTLPIMLDPNAFVDSLDAHYETLNRTRYRLVIECEIVLPTASEWVEYYPMVLFRAVKCRPDKMQANDRTTIERTFVNVSERITIEELCRIADRVKCRDVYED